MQDVLHSPINGRTKPHKIRKHIAVSPFSGWTCSETPNGCLEPQIVPNPKEPQIVPNRIYTLFLPVRTQLWKSLIYRLGTMRD